MMDGSRDEANGIPTGRFGETAAGSADTADAA
jgi:hypothetical protein